MPNVAASVERNVSRNKMRGVVEVWRSQRMYADFYLLAAAWLSMNCGESDCVVDGGLARSRGVHEVRAERARALEPVRRGDRRWAVPGS